MASRSDPQSRASDAAAVTDDGCCSVNVIRLWQLPADFFALSTDLQWSAIDAVTARATPLSEPRQACRISASDDALAVSFFLITLGLPFVLIGAGLWSAWVGSTVGLLWTAVMTVFLSVHPMPRTDWRRSRLSLALIRYFSMEALIDTADPLLKGVATSAVDDSKDVEDRLPLVCLACPHGVFNYGAIIWCCVSRWFVGWEQFTAAAAVMKHVPGLRYMDRLIWAVDADRRSIKEVLQRRVESSDGSTPSDVRHGGMLGVVPDGIAGAFRSRPGTDELVIGTKRGLMRICAEEGATVFPAWFFGTTDMLTVVTDPFGLMEYVSRKLQAGMLAYYGRWYLPVPRRVALTLACAPYRCKEKMPSPTREEVETIHDEVYGGLVRVYDKQKAYAGYPDRKLHIT